MDLGSLKSVLKLLSAIGLALSAFFLLPVATGYLYGEPYELFLLFDALLFAFNGLIYLLLIRHNVDLSLKQGILSVNAVWVMLACVGAVPLLLYTHVGFMQALFESISGFTTTGATVYGDIEALPKMVLMLRSLMHWLGGMGIIILGVGLFSLINPSGSLALFKGESTGIKMEKMTPKIKDTALSLWGIYVLLTAADALLLALEGMSVFDAVNHAFSTISTGGFSTKNASLGYFDSPAILWTTTVFMLLSGINFLAHLRLFYGDVSGYRNEEVRWYLLLFLALALLLSLERTLLYPDASMDTVTHAFFTVASMMTTTGFASFDYEAWGQAAAALIFVAMLIGGNASSTAGGVKVIRYIVVVKSVLAEIKQVLHPNAVVNLFIDRNILLPKVLNATYAVVTLFALSVLIIALYLFAVGYDATTSISTALATVGNIGPGFALCGPAQTYANFDTADLAVLSAGMILGRLEFFTVLFLFSRNFWKGF